MARTSLPPGFRFHPTDVELIMYYLKRKVMGKKLHFEAITELNIYKFGPWDLPDKSLLRSKDLEWYFFCPRERKYASGARTNRATENGYWKTTGKDRPIFHNKSTVGMIKTLVFHKGHAPKGERTDWVMHEYRIEDKNLADLGVVQDAYMLCKVFQKSGPGPKNGAQYGAPFNEEEWNDGETICAEFSPVDGRAPSVHVLPSNQSKTAAANMTFPGSTGCWSISEPGPSSAAPSAIEVPPDLPDLPDDDIVALLAMFTEDNAMLLPNENKNNERIETVNNDESIEALICLDGNDIYNGLGDLGNGAELSEAGFNFSTTQDGGYTLNPTLLSDTAFLELNDLGTPLRYPAEASESVRVQTGSSYAPYTCYMEGSYCEGSFPSAVHNFSGLNQSSALPEGSHWLGDNLEVLRKEDGIGNTETHGFNAISCNAIPISRRQPERNIIAEQIQRRGSFCYFQ